MGTAAQYPMAAGSIMRWLEGAAAWLDRRGKLAWIAAMVVSFAILWPVGLAILAYMIWSKRMFGSCNARRSATITTPRSSGNTAFDAYRDKTLRRLQDEQASFEQFMERLRAAKDKAEFDQFMDERSDKRRRADEGTGTSQDERS